MPILSYVSRRLHIFGRPKRGFVQPLVFFAWKKLLYQPRNRPHFSQSFRPRHLTLPPAQAPANSAFQAGRTVFLYYVSRKVRARPSRKLLPLVAAAGPVGPFYGARTQFLYYVSRRLRLPLPHRGGKYAFAGAGPTPPGNITDWRLRAIRRGRR